MQITITDKSMWDYPITVQRVDGEEGVVWCNHAGDADEEEVHNMYPNQYGSDIEWTDRLLICLKCGAYKLEAEERWENAPFAGER